MRALLLAATAALLALPAQAQNPVSYSDNTATNPDGVFDRPQTGCMGGNESAYDAATFSLSVSGTYVIDSVQNYDGYLVLYRAPFDPESPFTNCLATNDGNLDSSQIVASLSSSESYVLVTAGFAGLTGAFTNTISGPEGAAITLEVDGGEMLDVDLAVDPLVTTVASLGGKARFGITVTNNEDTEQSGALLVTVNGETFRTLLGSVRPNRSRSFQLNLGFPASIEPGIYDVSFAIQPDEGEVADMAGPFDVTVGDVPRLAHPSAVAAQFKKAGDEKGLSAYLAERHAAAAGVTVALAPVGSGQPVRSVRTHEAATQ